MNLEPFHQVSGDIVVGLKHKGSVSQKLRLTATYNAGSSPTESTNSPYLFPSMKMGVKKKGFGMFLAALYATLYSVADTVTSHNTATSLNTLDGCIGLSSDFTQ